VYIREAHAIDSRSPMFNGPVMEDPVSDEERIRAAGSCMKGLDFTIPAIVDKIDDRVGLAYGGWPDRLYLVNKEGKIAYAGGQGPFNFHPDELERAIQAELKRLRRMQDR